MQFIILQLSRLSDISLYTLTNISSWHRHNCPIKSKMKQRMDLWAGLNVFHILQIKCIEKFCT